MTPDEFDRRLRGYNREKEFNLMLWRADYVAFLNAHSKRRVSPQEIVKLPTYDKTSKPSLDALRKFEESIKGINL